MPGSRTIACLAFAAALAGGHPATGAAPTIVAVIVYDNADRLIDSGDGCTDCKLIERRIDTTRTQIVADVSKVPGFRGRKAGLRCDSAELGAMHVNTSMYIVGEPDLRHQTINLSLFKVGKADPLQKATVKLVADQRHDAKVVDLMNPRRCLAMKNPSRTS